MRKYIIIIISIFFSLKCFSQIDYKNWNWESNELNNWNWDQNSTRVKPAFASARNASELMYRIIEDKDYTYKRGWRLINVELNANLPYFVLYNVYTGVLRGFIYLDAVATPDQNLVGMILIPNSSLRYTKLLHFSDDKLSAINQNEQFSKEVVSAFTTAGLDSWAAVEIPLLFDNTIANINAEWTIRFVTGTESALIFSINGTSVPTDKNGNLLFAHSSNEAASGSSIQGQYASIHKNIKSLSDWGNKLHDDAVKMSKDTSSSTPKYVKDFANKISGLGVVLKGAKIIGDISGGINVALGFLDFFMGGSNSTMPIGYSHKLEGSGSILTLNHLGQFTKKVPGSINATFNPNEYGCSLGVMNILNTPTIKKTTPYLEFSNPPRGNKKGYFSGGGNLQSVTYIDSYKTAGGSTVGYNYLYTFTNSDLNSSNAIKQYKMDDNIDFNVREDVEVLDANYAIIFKDNRKSIIENKEFIIVKTGYAGLGSASSSYKFYAFIAKNPVYEGLTSGRYELHEYTKDESQNTYNFIYGTPYMSKDQLKGVTLEIVNGVQDVSLAVIIKYRMEGDDEIRYFKGTYKMNEQEVAANNKILLKDEKQQNFPLTSYWADDPITLNTTDNATHINRSIKLTAGFRGVNGFKAKASYAKNPVGNTHFYPIPLNCGSIIQSKSSNSILSVDEEVSPNTSIILYPNPTNGILKFECKDNNIECVVNIYNTSGKLIYTNNIIKNGDEIDLTSQAKGLYLARISINGEIITQKILLK